MVVVEHSTSATLFPFLFISLFLNFLQFLKNLLFIQVTNTMQLMRSQESMCSCTKFVTSLRGQHHIHVIDGNSNFVNMLLSIEACSEADTDSIERI